MLTFSFWSYVISYDRDLQDDVSITESLSGASRSGFHSASIQLLALLLVACTIKSVIPAPITKEDSADETSNSAFKLAELITDEARILYKELCATPNLCGNSMERTLKKEMKIPEITTGSPCLSKDFDKQKCLHEIHRDLDRFQPYLTFLKESFEGKRQKVEFLQLKTSDLTETVKKMENNPSEEKEKTHGKKSEDLQSSDPWTKKMTIYIILQSFKDYMQKTTRAVEHSLKNHN
ncbi:interleukin-6 [Hyperolius riggenbachi]|uniref:interleukin-6 n=1 Tax=Hyperolius riggenbachi TaxID=752182 RepID=UPI0035A28BE2